MVGGVLAVVAAIAVVLVISFVSPGPSSGNGCIYATVPGSSGPCRWISVATPPGHLPVVHAAYARQAAQTIAGECRKAGLPVGS